MVVRSGFVEVLPADDDNNGRLRLWLDEIFERWLLIVVMVGLGGNGR